MSAAVLSGQPYRIDGNCRQKMDKLFFFYLENKKAVAVINRSAYCCCRPSSLEQHGLSPSRCRKIYERDLSEAEETFFKGLYRVRIFFYDSIEQIIAEEAKAGVPALQIEELRKCLRNLEFRKHQPELLFVE